MSTLRKSMGQKHLAALGPLVAWMAFALSAHAAPAVLHEPIPDDARVDLALGAVMPGDVPAVVETPGGLIGAPDVRRPLSTGDSAYSQGPATSVPGLQPDATFVPDRDTRRPDSLPYDDPFTPSNAPFKRLVAFDAVTRDFALTVVRPDLRPLPRSTQVDAADDRFFADIVVEGKPGQRVRIPTVGPDTRVIHAHAALGQKDLKFQLLRDDADNWFVEFPQEGRARLVLDLAIRRASLGGELHAANWGELPKVAALPANVAASAAVVLGKLGLSREQAPRDVTRKLVAYFRAFRDSEEPAKAERDVYIDLALGQKGVCRHRSYAFLVTALGLGIPTRMVLNEAHAWVEVHDGQLWHRIDLGGAGRMLTQSIANKPVHQPPPDTFGWPPGATRGEDIAGLPRPGAQPSGSLADAGSTPRSPASSQRNATQTSGDAGAAIGPRSAPKAPEDLRPPSSIQVTVENEVVRRGGPLKVSGSVTADRARCAFVTVEILFRSAVVERRVGTVATNAKGEFAAAVTIPPQLAVGDYDLVARTEGDLRCGAAR
ncbi:MAG: transglutaminase domain-containing protein [Myxococcales bacterium]|nr:transglutaminase domain-containing protein [Myxococcales bacterium]